MSGLRITITTGIFPPDIGGPASSVPVMARWLAGRGHAVRVVCLSDRVDHDDGDYPFEVVRIRRGSPKPWRALRTLSILRREARRSDVLFVNGLGFESGLAASLAGVPAVHKVVGDTAWERARNRGLFDGTIDDYQIARKGPVLRALDWIRTTPLTRSREVIVPSRYLAALVARWGIPESRIRVIPNAFHDAPPVASRAAIHESLSPFDGPTVVTVCRLVAWKGIDMLIDTLEELREARLVVVGDGPLRATLEDHARRRGVTDRVVFTGDVPRRAVMRCLASADLFVLNSTYEGLPHVVLEAMRAGVPVVATDAGGTSELVRDGENGLLVPAGDAGALRRAMRRLLENRDLAQRLVARASREIDERFTLDAMATRTERALLSAREEAVSCP